MRTPVAPGDFQRLAADWTSGRPRTTAFWAFVEDKLRARHDTAIFSKVENHEAFWILTDQEGWHARAYFGRQIISDAHPGVNTADKLRLVTDVVRRTKSREGTSRS